MKTEEHMHFGARFGFSDFISDGKWTPSRSGAYAEDCKTGRAIGCRIIKAIQEHQNPALLAPICRMVADNGAWDGVETGMFSAIGAALGQGNRA